MEKLDRLERRASRSAAIISIVVLLLVIGLGLAAKDRAFSGAFGDTFGVLTSLFSGIALAGLWLTIRLQKIELAATRDELRIQGNILSRQGFENTFFASMQLLQTTEAGVQNPSSVDPAVQGRQAFLDLVKNLNGSNGGRIAAEHPSDSPDTLRPLYSGWYARNTYNIGPYIDLIRQIVKGIFHDVQGNGFNIDHVVIAPSGIYSIETKTRTKPTPTAEVWYDGKTVLVAGQAPDRDPVRQAKACAAWIAEQLAKSTGKKMPVKSVVLFPGWWVRTRKGIRLETWVLNPKALSVYIAREPARLTAEEVSMASFHLERLIKGVS